MATDVVLFCERKKWHGRSISRALARAGHQAADGFARGLRLLHRDEDRARHSRARRPSAEGRAGAVRAGRQLRAGHDLSRRAACLARARRHGVERCARHRALRRQIHHHLLPATRRHPDALDLDRHQSRRGLRGRRDQARGRPQARAEAAVRRARRRLAADRDARRPRPAGRGERRLLSARVHSTGRRRLSRLADFRLRRPASSPR